jgi:hypothetical protein
MKSARSSSGAIQDTPSAIWGRLQRYRCDTLVFALLAVVVLCLFHAHLAGNLTFPWDFQGGYHSHAVARLRDGTFLGPPLWMPWGGFGIPHHLSLQDGAWYLPMYVYAALDGYDLVAATRLQVLHVLAGASGMYVLCRAFSIVRAAAMVAALAYLFSSSFYSNAQHVDIVRGAALLPWLLVAIRVLWLRQHALPFVALVLVLWQYLVGAYPGQVVAAAYFCGVIVVVYMGAANANDERLLARAMLLAAAVVCGAALSAVKFLPALLDASTVRQSAAPDALVNGAILTTLLFDFDVDFLPNDVTMRDLFVPWALLPLAAYGIRRSVASTVGISGIALSLAFVVDLPALRSLVALLPLSDVSRFPLSDYRPVLHISIALLAACGLHRLHEGERGWHSAPRYLATAAAILALAWFAIRLGHSTATATAGAMVLAIVAILTVIARGSDRGRWSRRIATIAIGVMVVGQGGWHVVAAGRTWRSERSDAYEYATFGNSLSALTGVDRFEALEYRPARVVYESLPVMGYDKLFSVSYQYAWYAEGFSAFGYEGVKSSPTMKRLYSMALHDASSVQRATLSWLVQRSSIYLLPGMRPLRPDEIAGCRAATCAEPGMPHVASMQSFRENGAVFAVDAKRPFVMIENEVMYPGWASLVCRGETCIPGPAARAVNVVLRAWDLPAGTYRLITFYRPPGWGAATAIAWAGAIGTALIAGVLLRRRRQSPRVSR